MHQAAHDSAEFLDALATIQIDAVKTLLENMTHPLWECDLLRAAFPDAETAGCQALILYRQHFLLFHSLYRLADEYLTQGRYLHIHFMRTSLSCLPQAGQCRHYHEETGCFCLAATDNDFSLCKFHRGKVPSEAIDQLSDRYFYLDWHNFFSLNSETAEKFVNGTWELLINHQDYLDCLKILDLPENATIAHVKQRFKSLARSIHPDVSAGNHEEFVKINNAYRRLLNYLSPGGSQSS